MSDEPTDHSQVIVELEQKIAELERRRETDLRLLKEAWTHGHHLQQAFFEVVSSRRRVLDRFRMILEGATSASRYRTVSELRDQLVSLHDLVARTIEKFDKEDACNIGPDKEVATDA